ncbi:MAG: hypothetical protein KatS3mg129_1926 [Leptospiraceae bacterium]|nr:MAG: hypothetical protein KatS3mg129_1926 [Leptospiraceae bacterium]
MKFLIFVRGVFNFILNDIISIFTEKNDPLKLWKLFLYFCFFLFIGLIIYNAINKYTNYNNYDIIQTPDI